MSKQLKGKRALVTGGASGIGRAICTLFMEEGASVAVADIDADNLATTLEHLAQFGPVTGVIGDVGSMADAQRMVDGACDAFHGLDILVCNAGITSVAPIQELTEEEFDAVIRTNVRGMFTLIKAAVPELIAAGGGSIVTLGSEMGLVAVPESPAYNASKGAVIMLSKSLALDLIRHNIRVNILCPGVTQTPLLERERDLSPDPAKTAQAQAEWAPIGRIASPREIAEGALFICGGIVPCSRWRPDRPMS
jgi:NAD(P)-dependent dehydrogenase (short-subunit alcohol dehydrogenase family)